MASSQYQVPSTPRVISPSPTPSETNKSDSYFPSAAANGRLSSPETISEDAETDNGSDPELQRARPRSRSPHLRKVGSRQLGGSGAVSAKAGLPSAARNQPTRRKTDTIQEKEAEVNGHLSPQSAGFGSAYWRQLSRSPSPLGLIPIHREWRTFIHRHEIPRKFLHVSIGFVTLYLYTHGYQCSDIYPTLFTMLVPIFTVDVVRMHYAPFNRVYIRFLGAFMRESEAHDKYNGVISYLAGATAVLYACPGDVALMSIVLLSWCDTAASTFGRLWGRYTPRIRKGKSLAGSLAAFAVGVVTALLFWGLIAHTVPERVNREVHDFAFNGYLTLPQRARDQLGWSKNDATIDGTLALVVVSAVSGFTASVSEAIDLWGFDDNLTIPLLCGVGLSAFFRVFA